jgi:maleate isomerase
MPGWKARIGYLSPSVYTSPSDWDLILPEGFIMVASGLNVRAHTPEEFNKAVESLESALSVFLAEEVDLVILGGITLGTQLGFKAETQVLSSLKANLGLPINSALRINTTALEHLQAKNVAIATAYREAINERLKSYFQEAGLEVVGMKGLNVATPVEQDKLPDYASYRAALELGRNFPHADAVLIHGRWASVAYVEQLEQDIGRPVVASNAASLWWALETLGMNIPIEGYGSLLRGESRI